MLLIKCSSCTAMNSQEDDSINKLSNDVAVDNRFKWLKGAQDLIASPTGHVVVQVAKELLNRSTGNSQVLNLNITNLIVILLLKVLIFTAGLLGAGHWGGYGYNYGRSNDNGFSFALNENEAHLITGFLAAQSGFDDCLYEAACSAPHVAYEYAKAAKALMEAIKKFEGISYNNLRYNDLIELLQQAAYNGHKGLNCTITDKCDNLR
uniref:Uncharacterized protein n=1 Tax=Glossina palpalis gambiensis TaxID=67801 RepID=A0A1B0BMF8_9MUSC